MSTTPVKPCSNSSTLTPDLNSVSLHLPPFWHHDPRIWFAQVQARFVSRDIAQELAMYYHVLAVLPPEIAADLRDILESLDTDCLHTQLREYDNQPYYTFRP
ncbi:hypothetical protein AHF37_02034 [Paragonimus kellicotti]|nr:hypothetical protein AHF37_02034 [Paragonimus kellicotti]